MSNRPEIFFRDFVQRSYQEWLADPLDDYRAKMAVHNANVMAERVWHRFRKECPERVFGATGDRQQGEYRNRLVANECADFGLVRDVDEGFKHVELHRLDARVRRFDQTGRGSMGWGEGGYGEGPYGGGEQLVITLGDGSKRSLMAVMQNVVGMWERLLRDWGLAT